MTLSSYDIFGQDGTDGSRTQAAEESSNALFDVAHGVLKGAFSRPVGGLLQIADKATGGLYDVDPNGWDGKIVAAGKEHPNSMWEQGGEIFGMLAPFIVARGGTKLLARGTGAMLAGTRIGALTSKFSPTAAAALENGFTGFSLGFVMPQDHGSGFVMDRIKSGLVEGGTFFLLGGRSQMLASKYGLNMSTSSELSLTSRMLTGAKIGGRSGLEAGLFHAQANAMVDGKLYASPMNYVADGLGFASFGAILGTAEPLLAGRRAAPAVQPEQPRAKAGSPPSDQVSTSLTATSTPPTEQVRPPLTATSTPPTEQVRPLTETATVPVEQIRSAEGLRALERQRARDGQRADEGQAQVRVAETEPIKFDKRRRLGGESEGEVYSNGDGTVTKVFHDANADVGAIKAMFDKLNSIGLKLPEISKIGKTAEGKPAIVMKQIGDGDHLQWQLGMGEIPAGEMPALNQQYYRAADILNKHGLRIDWNLKNMRWEDGTLWILDPSFMKNEPMGDFIIGHYAGSIGPRR